MPPAPSHAPGPAARPPEPDPVGAALAQVGDRWTFLVLREAFYGVHRFTEMQRHLGIARNLLSQRLDQLVEHGVLVRRRYSDRPVRSEYRLTEKGLDLYTAIVALKQWGERWAGGSDRLVLRHTVDGAPVEAQVRCTRCGERITAGDVHVEVLPEDAEPERGVAGT